MKNEMVDLVADALIACYPTSLPDYPTEIARVAIAPVLEVVWSRIASADLIFACEVLPGHPVCWNAAPAVLDIIDAMINETLKE